MTLGREMRWAYSTTLPSPQGVVVSGQFLSRQLLVKTVNNSLKRTHGNWQLCTERESS